jgi:hypothetical protein
MSEISFCIFRSDLLWRIGQTLCGSWKNLIDSGALIQDREDELIWSGDDNSGIMTVKNIYLAMMSTKGIQKIRG